MILCLAISCVFIIWLQLLNLHAAETHVHATFKEVRIDKTDQFQSYAHFPTRFRQYEPPLINVGPYVLAVDTTGKATIYPIKLVKPRSVNIFLNVQARFDLKQPFDYRCQIFEKKPTIECQWGSLSGRYDRTQLQNYQSIDPLTRPGYTLTSNLTCESKKKGKSFWGKSPKTAFWQKAVISSYPSSQAPMSPGGFINFDTNSQAAPWLPQPLPNHVQSDVAQNYDEEMKSLINQFNSGVPPKEMEYDSPVPEQQRLQYRSRDRWLLVKIYFFWPIYAVYYGFRLARYLFPFASFKHFLTQFFQRLLAS